MTSFILQGQVLEQDTGLPLRHIQVKPYTNGNFPGKLPDAVQTNHNGQFTINIAVKSLREFFEQAPGIFFSLYKNGQKKPFYNTEVEWNWRTETPIRIEVPVKEYAPVQDIRLQITDENNREVDAITPGDSVYINAYGLKPVHTYELAILANDEPLFSSTVITSREGNIETFTLWPQAGLNDPRSERIYTFNEAGERWRDVSFSVVLSSNREALQNTNFRFAITPAAPVIFHSDETGRVRNGFVPGKRDRIILSVHHFPFDATVRIYIVPARQRWQINDAFEPIHYRNNKPAVHEVLLRKEEQMQQVRLTAANNLLPGAYDFIVRPLRYGYEEDRLLHILPHDILVGNRLTGIVIREEFMHGKLVQGGCINKLDVSGRGIAGQPYFQYADTFEKGEDVYFALDPNIVDPGNAGKMCALYVVPNKTETEWNTPGGNTLAHLPVLGGNAAVQKFLVQTYCVNANKRLLWPAAAIEGEYDIVADFGNNSTDATAFVNDDQYNAPLDIIDGYFATGFRVIEDPTTITPFNFFGQFDYSEATKGTATVSDEFNFFAADVNKIVGDVTLPLRARVMFPADGAGAVTAAQISNEQANYPLIVIVHGMGHSFTNYDYLLQHFAQNGFIAASIHLSGMGGLGRANTLFHHIDILKAEFGAKVQDNIGIMGHSRGGEGVVKAARINTENALGHDINAVISLAPTDQYGNEVLGGSWATPYLTIHGSLDGDVSIFKPILPGAFVQFTHRSGGSSLYDRANGAPKTMVWVYGATHNGFIGTNDSLPAGDAANTITPVAQQTIAKGYMNAFFRKHLLGETKWDGLFTGEWKPQATTQADAGSVKLFVQHAGTSKLTVDHFEGAHTTTSWQTSTIGGVVSQTGLPANPIEEYLHNTDDHSAHDTSGLLYNWNSLNDKIEFNIPAANKNVSAWKVLSFRICQRALDAANPANLPANLRVALRDGSGNERAIRVSAFAEIPFPQQRTDNDKILSMMRTVRIPLTAYTIVCLGIQKVDLTDITKITFLFSEQTTGSLEMDDLCFTN
jgi:hypothetical protein